MMDEQLFKRIHPIIQHAYDHATAVKAIFDGAGLTPDDIQTFTDLDRIPVTTKDRLAELQQENPPFGGFLAVPPDQLEHIFLSPGPLYEPGIKDNPVLESIREMLSISGFRAGDVVINTFGYHLIPTGLAIDETLRELGATVVPTGVGNADLQVKLIIDLGVNAYVGTPSWLMATLQNAEEKGLKPKEDLPLEKALFFSAEPLPPSMRQTFVETYGLKVTNAYGTAECGFLAYDQEGAMHMRLLETAIVQVVNPENGQSVGPGEVGEVVVSTFNRAYPLIRLGTGDLAMSVDPKPGESRQGERSIILVGRVGDAVKVRGMFVHPNQLRFAFGQVPGVARGQAVVRREGNRDTLTLRVVLAEGSDEKTVSHGLAQAVQSVCRVKVDGFEFMEESELPPDSPPIVDQRSWE
jgi:phenylacetate-CoA ligase